MHKHPFTPGAIYKSQSTYPHVFGKPVDPKETHMNGVGKNTINRQFPKLRNESQTQRGTVNTHNHVAINTIRCKQNGKIQSIGNHKDR